MGKTSEERAADRKVLLPRALLVGALFSASTPIILGLSIFDLIGFPGIAFYAPIICNLPLALSNGLTASGAYYLLALQMGAEVGQSQHNLHDRSESAMIQSEHPRYAGFTEDEIDKENMTGDGKIHQVILPSGTKLTVNDPTPVLWDRQNDYQDRMEAINVRTPLHQDRMENIQTATPLQTVQMWKKYNPLKATPNSIILFRCSRRAGLLAGLLTPFVTFLLLLLSAQLSTYTSREKEKVGHDDNDHFWWDVIFPPVFDFRFLTVPIILKQSHPLSILSPYMTGFIPGIGRTRASTVSLEDPMIHCLPGDIHFMAGPVPDKQRWNPPGKSEKLNAFPIFLWTLFVTPVSGLIGYASAALIHCCFFMPALSKVPSIKPQSLFYMGGSESIRFVMLSFFLVGFWAFLVSCCQSFLWDPYARPMLKHYQFLLDDVSEEVNQEKAFKFYRIRFDELTPEIRVPRLHKLSRDPKSIPPSLTSIPEVDLGITQDPRSRPKWGDDVDLEDHWNRKRLESQYNKAAHLKFMGLLPNQS